MGREAGKGLGLRLEPPSWWYGRRDAGAILKAGALWPLGLLYDAATRGRWRLARSHRSRLPVICVGGFTAGGAGKTPLAMAVARMLAGMGVRCAFLSRGYGGRVAGPHRVDPARDAAGDVGDEPLLLARIAPTVVARRRPEGARLIETLDVDAIVMDDGLQNPSLAKDLTIAVVDGGVGLGNGLALPAGPLRAGLAFQLARTDAVVVIGPGDPGDAFIRRFAGRLPVLRAAMTAQATMTARGDASWLAGESVIAFAGIGRPEKFFDTMRELGADLRGCVAFPDHYALAEADAAALLAKADATGAFLVTTAKDRARLGTPDSGALARLAARVLTIPVGLAFPADGEARLRALLSRALGQDSGGTASRVKQNYP